MAYDNDVIDLTTGGPGADKYLNDAILNSSDDLVLTMADGTIHAVSLTPLTGGHPVEHGGIDWANTTPYEIGDLVTQTNRMYICQSVSTGEDPSTNHVAWLEIVTEDFGGKEWDAAHAYDDGDIVTVGRRLWVANTNTVAGESPSTEPTKWDDPVSSLLINEVGGLEWVSTTAYKRGSIVSVSEVAYVAKADNTNNNPATTSAMWEPVATVSIDDTRGGKAWDNSIQYIAGDIVSRGGTGYVSLSTNTNQDPISTPVDWESIRREDFGGKVWNNSHEYAIGDIISKNQKSFIAITVTTNVDPETHDTDWYEIGSGALTEEFGGKEWTSVPIYEIGDIVSEGSAIYIALTANQNTIPSTHSADWFNATSTAPAAQPRGGVAWDATLTYQVGDMVSKNNITFLATSGSSNVDPETNPGAWRIFGADDLGGRLWEDTISYRIGDIVAHANVIYTATANNLNSEPGVTGDWVIPVVDGEKTSILMKHSAIVDEVPLPIDIDEREFFINTADGKVYIKKTDGSIATIGGGAKVRYIDNPGNPGHPSVDTIAVDIGDLIVAETNGTALTTGDTAYTLQLPAVPKDNDIVRFMDGSGYAANVPVLVDPNGKTLDGSFDDLTCDVNWFDIKLVYNNNNWSLGGK